MRIQTEGSYKKAEMRKLIEFIKQDMRRGDVTVNISEGVYVFKKFKNDK